MSRLRQIVAAERLLGEARLQALAREAEAAGEPLVARLVDEGVAEEALAAALARHLRLPLVELDDPGELDAEALRLVAHDSAMARRMVPIGLETPRTGPRILRVAMADPSDAEAVADLEAQSGCRVALSVARLSAVDAALRAAYRGQVTAVMGSAPRRVPFGGELAPRTVQTQPFRQLEDEAPFEMRHRALLELLVEKGVITWDEYAAVLRRRLEKA